MTTVGSAGPGSESFYGTFDQGGNVEEWNEQVSGSSRGVRGGSWLIAEAGLRSSDQFIFSDPTGEVFNLGFRVASAAPPIPAVSIWGVVMMLGLLFITGTVVFRRVKIAT